MSKSFRFYYHLFLLTILKRFRRILTLIVILLLILFVAKFFPETISYGLTSTIDERFNKPTYIEGIVGSVETLNPVYEETLAEEEINSLIFRGLTKLNLDGSLEPDLAESFQRISPTEYKFTLKNNQRWHDGEPVTTDDVIHTIELTQKSNPPSRFSSNFKDVVVKKTDDLNMIFELQEPFSPFILNSTLGIAPEHIPLDEYKPIGTGDFRVSEITESKITLESKTRRIIFKIYKNKEDATLAVKLGEVDGLGGLSFFDLDELRLWPSLNIYTANLQLRQTLAYFNLNEEIFKEKEIRQALSMSVPKNLVSQILPGFDLKVSSDSLPLNNWAGSTDTEDNGFNEKEALELLKKVGWERKDGVLTKENKVFSLNIKTSDDPELLKIADILVDSWESLGVSIEFEALKSIDLKEKIIPERDFEVLLTIQQLNADPDQYSLWHSSQTNDANISSLQSDKIDKILEDGRKIFEMKKRKETYDTFNRILADESPAVFLYYPKYFWLVHKRIENVKIDSFNHPADRFKNISEWKFDNDLFK